MNLFALGDFVLHSGGRSRWKIDCDALTSEDWSALALMLRERVGPFTSVEGVPRGGLALAEALRAYVTVGSGALLVVDDVLTTGKSMEEVRARHPGVPVIGAVVFARWPCAAWIKPLFQMEM